METAGTIIIDALQEIMVAATEQPVQPVEMSNAMRYLNRMMASWEGEGIAIGFTPILSSGDLVTIPATANEGVVFNLALKLAPQYDVLITPHQSKNAKEAKDSIRNLAIDVGSAHYQDTLPIGSGNEYQGYNEYHFYPGREAEILAETTGVIVQEDGNNG